MVNQFDFLIFLRFQRAPIVDRRRYWHLVPVKRAHTYRRLALEHAGAEGKVSECVVVRAHDRSLPLKIKMFFSQNRAQKSLGVSESKEAAQDWDNPKVIRYRLAIYFRSVPGLCQIRTKQELDDSLLKLRKGRTIMVLWNTSTH